MEVNIKPCNLGDATRLHELSKQTYTESFGSYYTGNNLAEYLHDTFNIPKLRDEINTNYIFYYFIYIFEKLAGYVKLNINTDFQKNPDSDTLEVEKIYITKEFQNKGLGKYLMNNVIEIAHEKNKKYIWLSVWSRNKSAQVFYDKQHFYQIGTRPLIIDKVSETSFILRKDLTINE